jgi:hypothetical protein
VSRASLELSISGPVRMGGDTFITSVSRLARAISTNEVVQIGTKLSAFDDAIVGGSASVLDFILLGFAVSLTAYTRLGSCLSAFRFASIGFWWMDSGLFSSALELSSLGLCRWPSF